jgi:hypothetical protein
MIKTLALLAALASPLPAFAQVTEDTLCSVATKESIIAPEQTAQAIVESWLDLDEKVKILINRGELADPLYPETLFLAQNPVYEERAFMLCILHPDWHVHLAAFAIYFNPDSDVAGAP